MNAKKNQFVMVVAILGLLALALAGFAALGKELSPAAASAAGAGAPAEADRSYANAPNRLLKVYAAPEAGASIVDVLTPSQKPLDIHGRSADSRWLAVNLPSGHGWIPASELNQGGIESLPVISSGEPAVAAAPMTATAGTLVKVYAGPGTGQNVVGLVMTYQEVQVTGRSADGAWLELATPAGWIPAGEVSLSGSLASLPILSAQ